MNEFAKVLQELLAREDRLVNGVANFLTNHEKNFYGGTKTDRALRAERRNLVRDASVAGDPDDAVDLTAARPKPKKKVLGRAKRRATPTRRATTLRTTRHTDTSTSTQKKKKVPYPADDRDEGALNLDQKRLVLQKTIDFIKTDNNDDRFSQSHRDPPVWAWRKAIRLLKKRQRKSEVDTYGKARRIYPRDWKWRSSKKFSHVDKKVKDWRPDKDFHRKGVRRLRPQNRARCEEKGGYVIIVPAHEACRFKNSEQSREDSEMDKILGSGYQRGGTRGMWDRIWGNRNKSDGRHMKGIPLQRTYNDRALGRWHLKGVKPRYQGGPAYIRFAKKDPGTGRLYYLDEDDNEIAFDDYNEFLANADEDYQTWKMGKNEEARKISLDILTQKNNREIPEERYGYLHVDDYNDYERIHPEWERLQDVPERRSVAYWVEDPVQVEEVEDDDRPSRPARKRRRSPSPDRSTPPPSPPRPPRKKSRKNGQRSAKRALLPGMPMASPGPSTSASRNDQAPS